ncbi:type VI secretion system tip protein VgrG [bacterium]|nr:type VI secretion system tip protein VgrG [bacterium]
MARATFDLPSNSPQFFAYLGGTEFRVVKFIADEGINTPGVLNLSVIGFDASLNLKNMLGQKSYLEIKYGTEDDTKSRKYHGVIRHIELSGTDSKAAYFDVIIVPELWTLSLSHRSCIHATDTSQNMTVRTVIERILNNAGLAGRFRFDLNRSYDPYSFLIQYQQTDLEFIQYLCEREGICYVVNQKESEEEYVFTDHSSDLPDAPGYNEVIVRRSSGALMDDLEAIEHMTCRHQLTYGKTQFREYDFKNANRRIHETVNSSKAAKTQYEYYEDSPGFSDQVGLSQQLKRRAQNLNDAFDATIVEASGFGDYRALSAGKMFNAAEAHSQSLNRKWLCTAIHYEGEDNSHVDEEGMQMGGGGSHYRMNFTAIPSDVTYRPVPSTSEPVIRGAQTAIVVGPDGEEIYTDQYGRVKVQMHWDRAPSEGSTNAGWNYDENASFWCRVAQTAAGNGWGIFSLPRIGQEVLVDFLGGSPNHPVVVGSLHNSIQAPPYSLPDNKTRTVIKTNSSAGGEGFNEIRIEDKKDSEQIFIHSQKDFDLRVKNDWKENIEGNQDITIGTQDGGGNLKLRYYGDVKSEIKMNKEELIDENYKLKIKGNHDFKVDGNSKTGITGDMSLKVGGNLTQSVTGNLSLSLTGDSKISVTGNNLTSTTGKHHFSGQEVVIQGMTGITLMAGASFIKLDASGISLMGPMIKVNSGGAPGVAQPAVAMPANDPAEAQEVEPAAAEVGSSGTKSTENSKPQ